MRNFNILLATVMLACFMTIPAMAEDRPFLDLLAQGAGAYAGAKACGGEDTSTACAIMGAQLGSMAVDRFAQPTVNERNGGYNQPFQPTQNYYVPPRQHASYGGRSFTPDRNTGKHVKPRQHRPRQRQFDVCERATLHQQNGGTRQVRVCQTFAGELHIFN